MKRLRLFIIDGAEVIERTYLQPRVRIGRHLTNECQILDERVSRFHAQLECDGDALVLRDVDSRNGTLLLERASCQVLRGKEARSSDGCVAFFVGAVRVLARIEEDRREGASTQTGARSTTPRESVAVLPESGSGVRQRCAAQSTAFWATSSNAARLSASNGPRR